MLQSVARRWALSFVLTLSPFSSSAFATYSECGEGASDFVAQTSGYRALSFKMWRTVIRYRAMDLMDLNIHPEGTAPGVVVAAIRRADPDYFRTWDRDSAIVMGEKVNEMIETSVAKHRERLRKQLERYIAFLDSIKNDRTKSAEEFGWDYNEGEPLRGPDGKPLQIGWGRPQNDGPADIVIKLGRMVLSEIKAGRRAYVDGLKIFSPDPAAQTILTNKANFTQHHWQDFCFEPWEEEYGLHLPVLLVQRKALLIQGAIARRYGHIELANAYREAAIQMEPVIRRFWKASEGYLFNSEGVTKGMGKEMNLDIATLIGAKHGSLDDPLFEAADLEGVDVGLFGPASEEILATRAELFKRFKARFPYNAGLDWAAIIGRYLGDKWAGARDLEGYAWFIATLQVGETDFAAANAFEQAGRIAVTPHNLAYFHEVIGKAARHLPAVTIAPGEVIEKGDARFATLLTAMRLSGDAQLMLVQRLAGDDGRMSEGIDPKDGSMQGPESLTWNYEALLSALRTRDLLFPEGGWQSPLEK